MEPIFVYAECTAFTFENNKIIRWTVYGTGEYRVFESDLGRRLLRSDNGQWWDQASKSAVNCRYAKDWFGEYPWSSWCRVFRIGVDGSVFTAEYGTEINPRGMTLIDRFEQDCLSFVP